LTGIAHLPTKASQDNGAAVGVSASLRCVTRANDGTIACPSDPSVPRPGTDYFACTNSDYVEKTAFEKSENAMVYIYRPTATNPAKKLLRIQGSQR